MNSLERNTNLPSFTVLHFIHKRIIIEDNEAEASGPRIKAGDLKL